MIPILDKIRRAGGRVVVRDQAVRIEAPPGTLSDQDRQVLAQHRETLLRLFPPAEPVVVDPYLDQERQAIQWVESLSPAEAEVVVETAVRDWGRLTGRVRVHCSGEVEHVRRVARTTARTGAGESGTR